MKAVKCYGAHDVNIVEINEPSVKAGEVKIKIKCCGICGSDLHLYKSGPILKTIPAHKVDSLRKNSLPFTMGHEFSGEIVEIGTGVSGLRPGDRVTAQPFLVCHECYWCRQGRYNICPNIIYLGFMADGCFADYAVVPAYTVHQLSADISYEKGAFVEPLAVALRGVKRGGISAGDSVAVIGAGPIGLLAMQVALADGAEKVFVVARGALRRETAVKLGATAVYDPGSVDAVKEIEELTNGIGTDVSIECAGDASSSSHQLAVRLTRRGGKIVMLGVAQKPVEFSFSDILLPEKDIITSSGHVPNDFTNAIDLLNSGVVNTDILTTDKIALSDIVKKGFQALEGEEKAKHIKILVSPEE